MHQEIHRVPPSSIYPQVRLSVLQILKIYWLDNVHRDSNIFLDFHWKHKTLPRLWCIPWGDMGLALQLYKFHVQYSSWERQPSLWPQQERWIIFVSCLMAPNQTVCVRSRGRSCCSSWFGSKHYRSPLLFATFAWWRATISCWICLYVGAGFFFGAATCFFGAALNFVAATRFFFGAAARFRVATSKTGLQTVHLLIKE